MGLRLSPRVEEGSTEVSVADVFSAEGVIMSRGVAVDHVSTQSSLPPSHIATSTTCSYKSTYLLVCVV